MKRLCALAFVLGASPVLAADEQAVIRHYADLAHAMYADSLATARTLSEAVDALVANPGDDTLAAARDAWRAARVPYQQTEAYRFGNAIVDDWEGKVNAWPLDEGLIDYVATSYGDASDENPFYTMNVIANPSLTVGGQAVDASTIDKALLSETLHEIDGVESNVATGYHAIEFLLWGQDLNGSGPGAGDRPAADFDTANCANTDCARRAAYLVAASELLVDDLAYMVAQWEEGGEARQALVDAGPGASLATILTGLGSLSYGELAGERMKLGLMLHDPEEEHDCFSDNTHWSHYYDALGVRNVYTGAYQRIDGSMLEGPSIAELVAAKDADADAAIRAMLDDTMASMQVIVDSAENDGVAYDQLIGADNALGNAKVMAAVDALVAQTKGFENAVSVLGLDKIAFEGSDSLDNPGAVIQ